ncbi:HNH endonuclease family protein, partial [Prescottella equi]|uniref:HNH endonuclease family protein n=1 Tax=Rhodococcus hoagii TaxID=43767 RepID=UPI003B0060E4
MFAFTSPDRCRSASRRARTGLIAAAATAAAVLALTACEDADAQPDVAAASSAAASTTASAVVSSSETALPPPTPLLKVSDEDALRAAAATLDAIPVKGRAPKTGYDRTLFGQAWSDDVTVEGGHNGCDTRNDILRRDLTAITIKPGSNGCTVLTGTLNDTYTGRSIAFTRGEGTSNAVQIDHIVALSDAWQKGAQQLDEQTRRNLANDPLNLQAVDGPTNGQKSDGDAATWLPPNKAYRCTYVTRQFEVKLKYGLWMTQAEKDAIARELASCTGAPAPAPVPAAAPAPITVAPAPPPVREQAPAPAPAPAPSGAG